MAILEYQNKNAALKSFSVIFCGLFKIPTVRVCKPIDIRFSDLQIGQTKGQSIWMPVKKYSVYQLFDKLNENWIKIPFSVSKMSLKLLFLFMPSSHWRLATTFLTASLSLATWNSSSPLKFVNSLALQSQDFFLAYTFFPSTLPCIIVWSSKYLSLRWMCSI